MKSSLTRVLVVDEDQEFLQEAMGELSKDCQVEITSTGRDALKLCEKFHPNVIILDCELKDMPFAALANRIRETDKNVIRIVLGRDYSRIERVVDAINEAHVHSFFRKPVSWVELRETIETKSIDYFVVKGRIAGKQDTQAAFYKLETILDEVKKAEKLQRAAEIQLAKAHAAETESFEKVKSILDDSKASRSRIKELEEMLEIHRESLRELELLKERDVDKIEREKEEYRSKLNVAQEEHDKALRRVEEIERALHLIHVERESNREEALFIVPDLKSFKRIRQNGKDSILIVDDEPDVLELIADQLDPEFNVYRANNARAAIELLAQHPDICLVVTDQRMPEMTGIELATETFKTRPELPFVLLTGFAEFEDARKAVNTGNIIRYLNKPYHSDELRETIRKGVERFDSAMVEKNIVEDRGKAIVDGIKELSARVKDLGFENERQVEIKKQLERENSRLKADKENVAGELGQVLTQLSELGASVAKEREAMRAEMNARRVAVDEELQKRREEAERLIELEREKHREELARLAQAFADEKKLVEDQIESDRKKLESEEKQSREKFALERAILEREINEQKQKLKLEIERVEAETASVKERLKRELKAELDTRRLEVEAEVEKMRASVTRDLDRLKLEKEKSERELNALISQATRAIKERDGEASLLKQHIRILEADVERAAKEMEKYKQQSEGMKADFELVLQSREALEAELASYR